MYDQNNVFAKILRGEIPCEFIVENDHAVSFYDANPIFETHVLVIPKGPYLNMLDFVQNASGAEQAGFWRAFIDTAAHLNIEGDFNAISNAGMNAPFLKQTVFHFHLHMCAGKRTELFNNTI